MARTVEATRENATILPEPLIALVLDARDYLVRGVRSGLIWSLLAIIALIVASLSPWLSVTLFQSYGAADFPVDLGWGVRNHFFSYGAYCDIIAVLLIVITALAFRASARRGDYDKERTVLIRPGAMIGMAFLALLPTLQFVFQFLMVDFRKVQELADQQYTSLQIQSYLGYQLASPMFPQSVNLTNPVTAVDTSTMLGPVWINGQFTPGGRFVLLLDLLRPGLLLPLLAGLFCFFGAFAAWSQFRALPERIRKKRRHRWRPWQIAAVVAGALVALVVFGRAPLALYFQSQGDSAFLAGDYRAALKDYYRAETLNPTLDYLPSFHQSRGHALALLGVQNDPDVGLYLANRLRLFGQMKNAWAVDQQLLQQYPNNQMVQSDAALTLELLVDQSTSLATTPPDNEQVAEQPQLVVNTASADTALPWLNTLLAEQPNSVYAHYLRGRILFSQNSYGSAAADFQAVISLSTDSDMLSTAYTYLSFCETNLGNYAEGRALLIKAVNLDYGYYNAIAREAASGLH